MKKTLKIFAIITAICALLAITAFAADFEHCADAMNELGLFKGTQNGYELDRAPNRAEAATMLVRLLGAEEEALALTYTAPYTDVADWAKPYVQYLHNKGLTKGTSATTFGYSDKCTAQQYATFLLRALGYSDGEGGDFTYIKAMEFAKEKGVVDGINCNEENFLRDHVAAMSYTALATATKSGDANLLSKLVSDGAISDAKGYDEIFASAAAVSDAMLNINGGKLAADMRLVVTQKAGGEVVMVATQNVSTVAETDAENTDKSKLAYKGTIETELSDAMAAATGAEKKTKQNVEYYYADGYMYLSANGQKVKLALSFEEAQKSVTTIDVKAETIPLVAIEKAEEKTNADGSKTYSIVMDSAVMSSIISQDGLEYGDISYEVTEKGEKPVEYKIKLVVVQTVDGVKTEVAMDATIDNISFGDDVKVTLPSDLGEYAEYKE
ncbi:MAG: S-layer homology domain-containing protein [Oscillospiraceae bacterium]|nr:S-layer homology domain-containing protein [Oscillospiraceae bacterium]